MTDVLVVVAVVFAVNLLPAFGPPTWAVLVFLRLNLDVAAVPLVLSGALAAATGRIVLARARGPCAAASPRNGSRASRRCARPRRGAAPARSPGWRCGGRDGEGDKGGRDVDCYIA